MKEALPHLTGIRALAALMVLVNHSADIAFQFNGVAILHGYVVCLSYLGMSLFFVLSGFIITYNYADRFEAGWDRAAKSFAIARFARLFPLYIFFILLDVQVRKSFLGGSSWDVFTHLTLTQSWFNTQLNLFPPAWSISTEWFFYLAFALIMLRPRLLTVDRAITTYCFLLLMFTLAWDDRGEKWEWLHYYAPYFRVGEFLLGCAAAKAVRRYPDGGKHSGAALVAIVALMGGNMAAQFGYYDSNYLIYWLTLALGFAPFIAYILYASTVRETWVTRAFSAWWIVLIGEMSYSVYLMQFRVFHMVHVDSDHYGTAALRFVMYIVLTLAVSVLTYRFIERPGRRLVMAILGQSPLRGSTTLSGRPLSSPSASGSAG